MIKTIAQYWKAVIAAVIAGLTALGTAVADGQVTKEEWIGIALAVLATPLGVGIVTNQPKGGVEPAALAARLDTVEAHLRSAPRIADAVTGGVVAGLQTLGHVVDTAPVRKELGTATTPDVPDPANATPEQMLASVSDVEVNL